MDIPDKVGQKSCLLFSGATVINEVHGKVTPAEQSMGLSFYQEKFTRNELFWGGRDTSGGVKLHLLGRNRETNQRRVPCCLFHVYQSVVRGGPTLEPTGTLIK